MDAPKDNFRKMSCLVERVATVNDDVGTGHKARSVRRQEHAEAVEVVDGTQAVLRSEGLPDLLLGVEGGHLVEGSVHVTGGDAVDTDVVLGPLSGERLAELDNTSLGGVVAGLLLGVVDDGARHGGDQDDGSRLASGHHGTANRLGHQEGTSQVDVDQSAEHGGVVLFGGDVRIGNAGRVDKNIGSAVELHNLLDSGINSGAVTNVDLEERDGEAGLLVKLSSGLVSKLLVGVEDDDGLSASLSTSASHVVTKTTGTTNMTSAADQTLKVNSSGNLPSDNDDLAHDAHLLESTGHLLVDLVGQGLNGILLGLNDGLSRALDGDGVVRRRGRASVLGVWGVDRDGNLSLLDDL